MLAMSPGRGYVPVLVAFPYPTVLHVVVAFLFPRFVREYYVTANDCVEMSRNAMATSASVIGLCFGLVSFFRAFTTCFTEET